MRERFYRFMAGRYGTDQLNRFLSIAAMAAVVLNLFLRSPLLWIVSVALLVAVYVRTFSRNLQRRRAENEKYLGMKKRVTDWFGTLRDRWKMRKDYVFFRCPSCHAMLRVPRGKGRLRVTCRKCGAAFERRS